MSLLRELPALLLLFVLFEPIAYANHELPTLRRERSSYVDTSQFVTDSYSAPVENKMNVHQSRKLPQEQPAYQYPEFQHPYPTYPPIPPRYSPFPPHYPQPYPGLYGPAYPQPYSYSDQYGPQYGQPLRSPPQPQYRQQLEPRGSSSSSTADENLFNIFQTGPERLKIFNNTSINPHLNHKLPEHTFTDVSSTASKVKKSTTVNDTISSIFKFGPKPFELFNNTSVNSELNHMQADQAIFDDSSTRTQPFKVQRAPDGKLNLVFNDNLFFQNTSTQPPVYRAPLSSPKRPQNNEAIIFPDDSRYGALCGISARSKSLCTNATNYPAPGELEAVFKQNNIWKFQVFFGEDPEPLPNISQRMNGFEGDEVLCESKQRLVFPQAGETKDANWLFIVNVEGFRQGVLVEECINENTTCNSVVTPRNHYKTQCRQNFVYRRLVALSPDKQSVMLDNFKIPSCCSCIVKGTS